VPNLRRAAKGQICMVRLPSVCNFNRETTVLAHYRLAGVSGIGMKSPDWMGAWACSDCHRAIDSGSSLYSREQLKLAHAEGIFRTLAAMQEVIFK